MNESQKKLTHSVFYQGRTNIRYVQNNLNEARNSIAQEWKPHQLKRSVLDCFVNKEPQFIIRIVLVKTEIQLTGHT